MRSINRSLGTIWLACNSRIARTLRCRGPPSGAIAPPVRASTGPSSRKSVLPYRARHYQAFSAVLAPSQRDLRRFPGHRSQGDPMRNRVRTTLATAAVFAGVTAAAATATVVDKGHLADEPYGFAYDCGFP